MVLFHYYIPSRLLGLSWPWVPNVSLVYSPVLSLINNDREMSRKSYHLARVLDPVFALVVGLICEAVEMPEKKSLSWTLQEDCVFGRLQLSWFRFSQQLIHVNGLILRLQDDSYPDNY